MSLLTVGFATAQETTYKVGSEVKNFSLLNVDGKMVSLADDPDVKGYIVVFTCNHCPFAQAYEQRIIDLDKKYRPLGYPVLAINPNDPVKSPDDNYEKMQERSKEKAYPFPYVFDATQEIAQKFGATRTPHVFILNKDKKKFVIEYIGAIDNNTEDASKADKKYVEIVIDELLAGKKPSITDTKAIGCTIKWKD